MSPSKTNLFVLTGAGISAESGIPTFQATNWRGRQHYELANVEMWQKDPALVWEYYSDRRARIRGVTPNAAHFALAQFEQSKADGRFFLCTQNVDSLHEAACSKNVAHIHGKLLESRCAKCAREPFRDSASYSPGDIPVCQCGGSLRPNVCWFGETPFALEEIYRELQKANVFLAVGTSGAVQPVASFAGFVRGQGGKTIFVGMDEPTNHYSFDDIHIGRASMLLPKILASICSTCNNSTWNLPY
jgi:NAD-dependent deacetylase